MQYHGWEFVVSQVVHLLESLAWPAVAIYVLRNHRGAISELFKAITEKVRQVTSVRGRGAAATFENKATLPKGMEIEEKRVE